MRLMEFMQRNLFELISYLFNLVLTVTALIVFLKLWGKSSDHWAQSGGLPPMSVSELLAIAQAPGLTDRLADYGMFWVSGVFAVGTMLLCLAGLHYLVLATRRLVASF